MPLTHEPDTSQVDELTEQEPAEAESPEPKPEPESTEPDAGSTEPDASEGEPSGPKRLVMLFGLVRDSVRPLRNPVVLVVLAVVLAALGGWWQWQAAHERSAAASGNQALVDTGRTTQVVGDVSDALNRVFSYAYDNTSATEQAARQVLTGPAASQYSTLFTQVRQQAATQKLTVTTRVVSAGVTLLDGDRAQLLVFLDQTATRDGSSHGSASAAELSITAQRQGSHWLITGIESR